MCVCVRACACACVCVCLQAGIYWVTLIDQFVAGWVVLVIGFLEVFGIFYVYGKYVKYIYNLFVIFELYIHLLDLYLHVFNDFRGTSLH